MIGVVLAAHNKERYISQCLESVFLAVEHPSLKDQLLEILVVLDDCSDSTEAMVAAMGVQSIGVSFQNVVKTRAVGAEQLLKAGARWLAFVVPPDWLARQIEFDADAVCGTVEVDSWREYGEAVRTQYLTLYQFIENHRHIHGANLGLSAEAYQNAGGFKHLRAHEDVQVVADLERIGARIVWAATNPVLTSAHRDYRCRGGFGDYLASLMPPDTDKGVEPSIGSDSGLEAG
ncbi:glycosyltransferase family 2 protein [Pseudomonas sp. SIMBA_041]|uniref:glycosyltransferase n=1 Tax=Pseudomonas sp. SIMBA_041 TaxID=3085782 RepID=UPI00397BE0B0